MKKTAFVLILLLTAGCAMLEPANIIIAPPPVEASETTLVSLIKPEEKPYAVLYETMALSLAAYEPAKGCYVGVAYDNNDEGIRMPERRLGLNHAVYATAVNMSEEYPDKWMLQCIAAQGTPLILLHQGEEKFSTLNIKRAAEWLGSYKIPMLVAYEPLTAFSQNIEAGAYRQQYRFARAIFMEYAPEVAFVWLADANRDYEEKYPGHDAVDWVGLHIKQIWEEDGYDTGVLTTMDAFYNRYHEDKPVMLMTGFSHFSERDYIYRVSEAAEALTKWYDDIRFKYPRVRLITYTDRKIDRDDFSVTRDTQLLSAYKASIENRHFLSSMNKSKNDIDNQPVKAWQRSPMPGYYMDGRTYLNAMMPGFSADEAEIVTINNKAHIDSRKLTGYFTIIDHEREVIYVYAAVEP